MQGEGMKRVNTFEEKENADDWSTAKILQIDGAGDCSESSESGSPINDVTVKRLFQTQACRKPRILQVDGVDDSCCTSSCSSSSECGSPFRDDNTPWKLGQVDGAMDFCNGNDQLEENPVRCTRCHRTYRTAQSFERHLQSCSADYILSCSESDSSEEDKVSSPEIECTVDNQLLCYSSETANSYKQVDDVHLPELISNTTSSSYGTPVVVNTDSTDCLIQNCSPKVNGNDLFQDNYYRNSDTNGTVPTLQTSQLTLSPKQHTISNYNNAQSHASSALVPSETSSPEVQQLKTYSRKTKNTSTSQSDLCQYKPAVVDYQTSAVSPTLIIQQIPTHSSVSPYIESLPSQTNSNNIQYQFITTIDAQEKPQVPLTIQLPPQINIQPVIPTVLGTIIQPNGVEQLVVNTPTPTVEVLNQQPVYITNVNQPVYMGMETVISNTVMSSSQFVSGMVTGSSYSATTTQVFQTSKPVLDLPTQSYIVVNTQSNAIPATISQNIYSPQSSLPLTYNYQETYKVKERTTYQQVTRQILQEENKVECVKMVNSTQAPIIMDKPVVQKVTVEKTHSFHKTATIPNLVNNINPLIVNSRNCHKPPFVNSSIMLKELPMEDLSYQRAQTQNLPLRIESKEENSHQETYNHQFDITNLNYISQKNNESIKNCNSQVNQQSSVKILDKSVKPVIKVKSNPNIKNCNFSVNIINTKSNVNPQYCFNVDTSIPIPPSNDLNQFHLKKIAVDDNTLQQKEKNGSIETTKQKRIPLKENKTVTNGSKISTNKTRNKCSVNNLCNPKLVYEISSQDGFSICSQDLAQAWKSIFERVQIARAAKSLPPLPQNPFVSDTRILGLDNNTVKYLVEQLPGDGCCIKYKPVYHKIKLINVNDQPCENPTGCIRTEPYSNTRRKYDMFSWLASRHRRPPKLVVNSDTEIVNGISRRATSLNLPMAMRFRHLKDTSKESVGVFRSDIHGRGLFCLRDIDSGEMVIEYAGEVIRSGLTDKRENHYTSKGIGCYMFRIDDQFVVDATMHGNAARFINHSCEPNCYSRVVDILGKKHILIFALRKIPQGEELTYDYKFPLEDDKITCHCLSRKCRKYLN